MANGNGNGKKTLTWYTQLFLAVGAVVLSAFIIWLVSQMFISWTGNRQTIQALRVTSEGQDKQIERHDKALLISQERQNKTQESIQEMQGNINRVLEILTEYKDLNKTLWDHNARLTQLEKAENPPQWLTAQIAEARAAIERIQERMQRTEQALYESRKGVPATTPIP